MIIKIQKGKRRKTEHGYQTYEEMQEYSPCSHCFQETVKENKCSCPEKECPKPKHIATVPFNKSIHPCNKDKVKCYEGDYYEIDKKSKIYPCSNC